MLCYLSNCFAATSIQGAIQSAHCCGVLPTTGRLRQVTVIVGLPPNIPVLNSKVTSPLVIFWSTVPPVLLNSSAPVLVEEESHLRIVETDQPELAELAQAAAQS